MARVHGTTGQFNIGLVQSIKALASKNKAFNTINHLRKRHETDRPTYQVEDFPYVTYSGRMRFNGFSCSKEIHTGTYQFGFWDHTDEQAAKIAGDFHQSFMPESYFTSYGGDDTGFPVIDVLYKNIIEEGVVEAEKEACEYQVTVEFKITIPRQS